MCGGTVIIVVIFGSACAVLVDVGSYASKP